MSSEWGAVSAAEWERLDRARAAHDAREAHRDRCEALVPELVEALRGLLATYEEGLSTPAIDKALATIAKEKDANT